MCILRDACISFVITWFESDDWLPWQPISYLIEGRVCYLTMCDRAYPKKLAFQYLEDLRNEFERVNGSQIETAARPYAFIKFGRYLITYLLSTFALSAIFYSYDCSHFLLVLNFLFFLFHFFKRHIYTENKEIVPGHSYSAQYCKVERWTLWSPSDNDTKCARSSRCWWTVGP